MEVVHCFFGITGSGVMCRCCKGEYGVTGVDGICSLYAVTVFGASSGIAVAFVIFQKYLQALSGLLFAHPRCMRKVQLVLDV